MSMSMSPAQRGSLAKPGQHDREASTTSAVSSKVEEDEDDDEALLNQTTIADKSFRPTFSGAWIPSSPAAPLPARSPARKPQRVSVKTQEQQAREAAAELGEDDEDQENEQDENAAPEPSVQRGHGPGILHQSEKPTEASSKDTSVNIATAFRQAASGPSLSGASANGSTRPRGNSTVGFLARAGDREVPLAPAAEIDESRHGSQREEASSSPESGYGTHRGDQDTESAQGGTTVSSKKRKKPSASSSSRKLSEKDSAFRVSKKELQEVSSDEFETDEEDIDLNELREDMNFPPETKYKPVSGGNAKRKKGATPNSKKKAKTANPGDDAESATLSPASKKTAASRRKSGASKDGVYKPGEEDEDDDELDTPRRKARGKGRAGTRKNGSREPSVLESVAETDDGMDRENSQAPPASVTSFYLHAPSKEPEFRQPQINGRPEGFKEPPKLTQTYPKSTNSYQPFFAFSTKVAGQSPAPLNGSRTSALRREESVASTSPSQDGTPNGDLTKASSNASFEQRGSDYDYAEEDRMAAAILAAKQRGLTGNPIPQGRSILADITQQERDRDMSIGLSEASQDSLAVPPAKQQHKGPRRAPAPPARGASVLSESTTGPLPEEYEPSHKTFGQKAGEALRPAYLFFYWTLYKPLSILLNAHPSKIWKWAVAIALAGLIIGSARERAAMNGSGPYWPLFGSSHNDRFNAPAGAPSNLDELVSRLTNLEHCMAALSNKHSSDHTSLLESSRTQSDTARRLSVLEADFESEKVRMARGQDALRKDTQNRAESLDGTIKSIKTQIDHLGGQMKTVGAERKQDAIDVAKMRGDLTSVNKDIEGLGRRLADLHKEVQSGFNSDELAHLVSKVVEDILPSRMAVSLDPKTGKVNIDPAFWQHLRSAFSPSGSSSSGHVQTSWSDFLASNQAQLQKLIASDIDNRVGKGAVLSRKSFTGLLERELQSLRTDVSQSTSESMSKLSQDLSAKIAKASSHASTSRAGTLKLSSGEDLNAIVQTLIDSALDKYSKDVLARPDFALYTAGGRIIPSLTTQTYEIRPASFSGSLISKITGSGRIRGKPPVTALHPDISVGQCWPFAGQTGQIGILLNRKIVPSDITIEHAAKEVALDVSSAPRSFEAWAVIEDKGSLDKLASQASSEPSDLPPNQILLAKGTYDVTATSNIQTFPVEQAVRDLDIPVQVVVLRILDNHGNENHTCLYRVRVGGSVAAAAV